MGGHIDGRTAHYFLIDDPLWPSDLHPAMLDQMMSRALNAEEFQSLYQNQPRPYQGNRRQRRAQEARERRARQ